MTGIGHSLTGMSLAALAMPRRWRAPSWLAGMAALAVLANVPDIDLPFWGHAEYLISHSIFVNVALIVAVLAVPAALPALRRKLGGWPVLAAGGGAWMSHLLLDSFYGHGKGIRIFWPFSSEAALNLAIPWFRNYPGGWPLDAARLKVMAIEVLFYGPLLAICLLWRLRRRAA